jgi:hypothetical protein
VTSSAPATMTAGVVAVLRVTQTVSHWTVSAVISSVRALRAPGSSARQVHQAGRTGCGGPAGV